MARIERSAGFVIYRVNPSGQVEYLVLDYGRHWDFAKGHIEKGESELAAATRELHEETGIREFRLLPEFHREITYYFRDRRKGLIRKSVFFFLAEVRAAHQQIVLSREHEGFAFLPFEAAIRRVTFPNAREVLRLARQQLAAGGIERA